MTSTSGLTSVGLAMVPRGALLSLSVRPGCSYMKQRPSAARMDTLLGPRGAGAGAAGPGWPVTDESPRSSSAWKDTTQDFAGLARICLEIRIVNCQRAMGYMAVRDIGGTAVYRYIHQVCGHIGLTPASHSRLTHLALNSRVFSRAACPRVK